MYQFKNSNELSAIQVNQISSIQINDLKQEISITLKNAKFMRLTYNDGRQMFDEYDELLEQIKNDRAGNVKVNNKLYTQNGELIKKVDKINKHLKTTTRIYAEKGKKLRQEKHELLTENQILKAKLKKYEAIDEK